MTHAPAFTRLRPALLAATALALPLPGCDTMNEWLHPTPAIRFAAAGDTWLKKPDLALVEASMPLTLDELQKLTPGNIKNFTQEQLDQIYARLTAGPIPDGAFEGELVFPKGRERRPPARRDRRRAARARGRAQAAPGGRSRPHAVEGQGLLSQRARAAQPHRGSRAAQPDHRRRYLARSRRSRSTARTSGCSFRRSSTAGRACSTAAGSR